MLADIERLSVEERILLVEEIWDTIVDNPEQLKLTAVQREELDVRLEALQANPEEGTSWSSLKTRLTSPQR